MKSIYLSLVLVVIAKTLFAQSTITKDSMLVVAAPTDSTAKGSVLVADSTGHAKWEQPGYVKSEGTFTISEDNKLVVENNAHVMGYLRLGKNSVYVGGFNKFNAPYNYENSEDIIFSDHSPTIINPSPRVYMWPENKYNGLRQIDLPTQNTLINPEDGHVGIGTRSPDSTSKLDINGLLKTTSIRIPGGQEGKVLVSDNNGLARWDNIPTTNNYWNKNGNVISTPNSLAIGQSELPQVGLDVRSGNGHIAGNALYFWGGGRPSNDLPYVRLIESWGMRFDSPDKRWVISTSGSFLAGYQPGGADYGSGNIYASGNVGIGTTDTKGYKLAVNGSFIATSAKVKAFDKWPDYCFKNGYKPMPIDQLEKYVNKYHHLPEVPSEAEVKEDGIDLAKINAALLKQIEELVLRQIEMEKRLQALEK